MISNKATTTLFGKAVRKARIDSGDTLYSMAQSLGMTSAYLCMVEHGKRSISDKQVNKIIQFFKAKQIETEDLQILAWISNGTIPVSTLPLEQQILVAKFAGIVMTPTQLTTLSTLLNAKSSP